MSQGENFPIDFGPRCIEDSRRASVVVGALQHARQNGMVVSESRARQLYKYGHAPLSHCDNYAPAVATYRNSDLCARIANCGTGGAVRSYIHAGWEACCIVLVVMLKVKCALALRIQVTSHLVRENVFAASLPGCTQLRVTH